MKIKRFSFVFKLLILCSAITFTVHETCIKKLQNQILRLGCTFDSLTYQFPLTLEFSNLKAPFTKLYSLELTHGKARFHFWPLLTQVLTCEITTDQASLNKINEFSLISHNLRSTFSLNLDPYRSKEIHLSLEGPFAVSLLHLYYSCKFGGSLSFQGKLRTGPLKYEGALEINDAKLEFTAHGGGTFKEVHGNFVLSDERIDLLSSSWKGLKEGNGSATGSLFFKKGNFPFEIDINLEKFLLRELAEYSISYTGQVNLQGSFQDILGNKLNKIRKEHHIALTYTKKESSLPSSRSLCKQLQKVPKSTPSVLSVKKIELPHITGPFNGSIIEKDGGNYYLFFRYDTLGPNSIDRYGIPFGLSNFSSHTSYLELDRNFKPIPGTQKEINVASPCAEDARVCQIGSDHFLVYNDFTESEKNAIRSMRISAFDPKKNQVLYSTKLDLDREMMEKNWVPFEFTNGENKEIYFVYDIEKQIFLKLLNPSTSSMEEYKDDPLQNLSWHNTWGKLRGGTPARLINNEYLAFFHSSFLDETGVVWYVMGAYTFDAKPPFRIKAISPYPILFEGIYDTTSCNLAKGNILCIFPMSYALEKKKGENLIHLSCGENDSAIKIVTFDQEALLKSLVKISQ